jgi:LPS-assembly lipoprotein
MTIVHTDYRRKRPPKWKTTDWHPGVVEVAVYACKEGAKVMQSDLRMPDDNFMMTRRRVVALAASVTLSGCGFEPVYMPTASGKAGVAQRELAAIQVDQIPDRPGQLLRQALQDRLEGAGSEVAHRYDLSVSFGISGEGIAVEQTTIATRLRLVGSATWTLTAQDPGRTKLTSGTAKAVDAINLFDTQIFAADLENEAITRRVAGALADQITLQLATYFRKQAAQSS